LSVYAVMRAGMLPFPVHYNFGIQLLTDTTPWFGLADWSWKYLQAYCTC